MPHSTYLSIDFGTSNSLVGAVVNGVRHEALALDPTAVDPTVMRTLMYYPNPDKCFYGQDAIQRYIQEEMEGRLFRSFKSHLSNQSYLGTVFENRILTLETIVGTFLLELKKRAEALLGTSVDKAVIGRPARYSMDDVADGFALHRMEKAAAFAGFKEVHFVPEPLAAAFDYRRAAKSEKTVLIGDFGGGTSDFTIINLKPNSFCKEDVLSIEGFPLAGDALDSVFMSHKLNTYFGAHSKYKLPMGSNVLTMPKGITLRLNHPAHIVHLKDRETYEFIKQVKKCSLTQNDSDAVERLFILMEDQQIFPFFEKIEATKRGLSSESECLFEFDYPGIEIKEIFQKMQFIQWSQNTKDEIFGSMDRCLNNAGLTPEQIDLVCLTGGTSKVPFIQEEFISRFGAEKLQTQQNFHSVLSGLTEAAMLISQGIKL